MILASPVKKIQDPDLTSISDSDDEHKISTQKRKAKDRQMTSMKAELRELLSQPLIARGISTRYITSGSRPIVDDLLAGEREYFSVNHLEVRP